MQRITVVFQDKAVKEYLGTYSVSGTILVIKNEEEPNNNSLITSLQKETTVGVPLTSIREFMVQDV